MIFVMKAVIINILNMTAWKMEAPELFGSFHICASLIAAAAAVLLAILVSSGKADRHKKKSRCIGVLGFMGWVLAVLEIWKQLFIFFIVNGGAYDWWYFPFQLCSVPMYLCILLPYVGNRTRDAFLTFIGGYTFVSAVATLIYPEDILRSYSALTVHGFVWHGLLLFISLVVLHTGSADTSARGLLRASVLFAILCGIAVLINILAEPIMHNAAGLPHSWAAMFYLNPYHISPQPLVGTIQKTAGIPAGLLLYSIAVAAAGSIAARLLNKGITKPLADQ